MDLTPTLLWQVVTTLAIAPLAYFLKASLDRLRQMELCLSRTRARVTWATMTVAERDHPLVLALIAVSLADAGQADALFTTTATL